MKYGFEYINEELNRLIKEIESTNPKYNNSYKCYPEDLTERLAKINIIYRVINSDINDYDKSYVLFSLYPSAESFRKSYALLVKFGDKDKGFDNYRTELNSFDNIYNVYLKLEKNIDIMKSIKYRFSIEKFLIENDYLDNYLYAEFVINQYINDKSSYKTSNFLQRLNIDKQTFEYCLKLVEFLNPQLYSLYNEKKESNTSRRNSAIVRTFIDLNNGISKGNLTDGTSFDMLEFLKRIPFKDHGKKFSNYVVEYLSKNLSSDYKYIINNIYDYLYKNKIFNIRYVSEEYLAKNKTWVNGVEITPEINHIIFKYMYAYDLPNISRVYDILVEKYVNNSLDLTDLDEKVQAKKDKVKLDMIDNPYKLVRTKEI